MGGLREERYRERKGEWKAGCREEKEEEEDFEEKFLAKEVMLVCLGRAAQCVCNQFLIC